MIVTSTGIVNGIIEDKYGKHGSQFNENGMPTYSLPLKIEDAPEGTKSFALVLEEAGGKRVPGHRRLFTNSLDSGKHYA